MHREWRKHMNENAGKLNRKDMINIGSHVVTVIE